ncbi:MAG: type VI secretion system baseplate subunit TssG [Pyrinomonadaceae bacterium]|nr:type VI secretion system baseplate subunit TssG [Pyrinomonadaceae bacterium]MCX7639069.1 type VI secretion system baseplate subunit TssG [Pyrinomonadaceae bacterium]MDW8303710.1 type VI secretion system baseplate subunit TssG [Acidobacteriota bacterium]
MNDILEKRKAQKNLYEKIMEEPYEFEFFQFIRLLKRIFSEQVTSREKLSIDELVRFRSTLSLEFPASEIQEVKKRYDEVSGSEKLDVFVNFIGMLGVIGAMPMRYTELAAERARYGDTALWAFLDIFTHRAVSLFYRAWVKYRFPIGYEQGEDNFTDYLFCLVGLGMPSLRGKMHIEDESLLPYAGLITQRPHSAAALKNIISDYFDVNVEVLQFQGQWIELERENITFLGIANSHIGFNAIVGMRIWDNQSKFRLRIGPLGFKQYVAFLPVGSAHKPLKSIVRFFVGEEFDFDIQLVLKAREVPSTILTTRAKRRPMLGWTSFLKSKPFAQDDEQLIFRG